MEERCPVRPTLIYFGKKYTNANTNLGMEGRFVVRPNLIYLKKIQKHKYLKANTNLGMEERCPVSPNFVYWSSCPYLYIELEADKIKR